MVALSASCWTVDMLPTNTSASIIHPEAHGFIVGKVRQTRVRLTLNNAASGLVYPPGGVPLPTFNATTPAGESSYGMRRNLSHLIPVGESMASVSRRVDVIWKYAPSGGIGVMRAFMSKYTVPTALAGTNPSVHVTEMEEAPTTWSATLLTDKTPSFEFIAVGW